jgi:rod shape-determining protein MreC
MQLGTIDRAPPPFFRQGPTALTKLTFGAAFAVFLMVADTKFKLTQPLRAVVATALHPVQRALLVPAQLWAVASDYAVGMQRAQAGESSARRELALQAERSARVEQLLIENTRLRALLELRPSVTVRSQVAEVLYDAPDPFSRKVIVDRGTTQGVTLGSPVISEAGVLGQVTRVYPLSSEVTLLTDKDAAIPVLNVRSQARSAAYGSGGSFGLELRFMAGNADVLVGDVLVTSGIDGVYPAGIAVAKVLSVERKADSGFARILLTPAAAADGMRHVLLVEPVGLQLPPKPENLPTPEEAKLATKRGGRK